MYLVIVCPAYATDRLVSLTVKQVSGHWTFSEIKNKKIAFYKVKSTKLKQLNNILPYIIIVNILYLSAIFHIGNSYY